MLFIEHPDFVWGLIGSLYMANIFTVIINIAFIPLFVKVLVTPMTILAPVIFVLCVVGGYAPENSLHDVWLMILFGVCGYILRKLDYPVAPAVLAIVLGELAESSLRQSLISSHGDPMTFVSRPISATIIFFAVLLILTPVIRKFLPKKVAAATGPSGGDM
jgi:putative tricarboxylic transport membrane protein